MQKTFFFHIPKCAGMSAWHALWDIYGFKNVYQVGVKAQRDEFEAMTPRQRLSYGAIGGHGFLDRFTSAVNDFSNYYKIVTFRNPVDRIVSEYYFIRNIPDHFKHEEVSSIPLHEFANQKDTINMQTRLLCREPDPDRALAVLDEFFDDWCLMEDVNLLIDRLYRRQGKIPKPAGHQNKGIGRRAGTEGPEVIAELEALNAADMTFFRELQKRALRIAPTQPESQTEVNSGS